MPQWKLQRASRQRADLQLPEHEDIFMQVHSLVRMSSAAAELHCFPCFDAEYKTDKGRASHLTLLQP